MKMKKLLAGILSATMVATMIPASMAFSSVSAEVPTDGLVLQLTYDNQSMANSANKDALGTPIYGSSTQNSSEKDHWIEGTTPSTYYNNTTNGSDGYYFRSDASTSNYHLSSLIENGDSNSIYSSTTTTVSFWISNMSTAANGNVLGHDNFAIYTNAATNQIGYVEASGVMTGDYTVTLPDAGWHMVTLTNNNGTYQWYLDGVATGDPATGRNVMFNSVVYGFLYGGGYGYVNLKASVDNFYIYNAALSAEQVSSLYEATKVEGVDVDVTYDLTTDEGREDWSGYTASSFGATYTEGNDTITEDANGVTFTRAGLNSYSIANPLKGNVTDGFSITVNATIPSEQALTQFEGFFGFNNHTSWNYWQVSNNGATLQTNSDLAYTNWTGEAPGDNPFYYGIVGAEQNAMRDVEYTLSVDKTGASIYLNGELVATYTEENSDYISAVTLGAANGLNWFNLGFNAGNGDTTSNDQGEPNGWNWFNTRMTVTSVSFSTTPIEDKAQEIADTLELNVRGMQKGTFTPTDGVATQATRFVANLNSEALANDAITMLGWAAEANATTEITNPETATYASVTTVTNDSTLAPEGTFAYTYVVTDGAQTGVVPCVQVTVGGVEFWFSYNGYSGSLESTVDGTNNCQVVAAIEVPDAAFTSTQA